MVPAVKPTWLTWVQCVVIYLAAYLAYHYVVHRALRRGAVEAALVCSLIFSTAWWLLMRRRWRRTNGSRQVVTRPEGI